MSDIDPQDQINSNAKAIEALGSEVYELKQILGRTLDGVQALSSIKATSLKELADLARQVSHLEQQTGNNTALLQEIRSQIIELERNSRHDT